MKWTGPGFSSDPKADEASRRAQLPDAGSIPQWSN